MSSPSPSRIDAAGGMSGSYGPHYSIQREGEDLGAIVGDTGAQYVLGAADGGLFALHGSLTVPAIRKVAVFEPVLFVGQPGVAEFIGVDQPKRTPIGERGRSPR